MDKPREIIAEKSVSALLDNAQMARISKIILGLDGQLSAKLSKKMIGGQWISGKAYLTPDTFEFQPGILNRPFFKDIDALCMRITWSDIKRLEKRFGMVSPIIDLETLTETHSIRCNGAEAFLQRMNALRVG
ncbi:MAG: hypothetical protein AAF437_08775 [Pseudomonadota bacterium]